MKLSRNVRSQAAMEFLMTYGWAILVTLTAVSSLAYFGVLSPDNFLPETCKLPMGLSCLDMAAGGNGEIYLSIMNNMGTTIDDFTVTIYGSKYITKTFWDESGTQITFPRAQSKIDTDCFGQSYSLLNSFKPGEKIKVKLTKCSDNAIGTKGEIKVGYTNTMSGLAQTGTGELTAKVIKKGDVLVAGMTIPSCRGGSANGICEGSDNCQCPDCSGKQHSSCSASEYCASDGAGCISLPMQFCNGDGTCQTAWHESCSCSDCDNSYLPCSNGKVCNLVSETCVDTTASPPCNNNHKCEADSGETCSCSDCNGRYEYCDKIGYTNYICNGNTCVGSTCNKDGNCNDFMEDCTCSDCFGYAGNNYCFLRYPGPDQMCLNGECVEYTGCDFDGICEYSEDGESCSCQDCVGESVYPCSADQVCHADGTCVPGTCDEDTICEYDFEDCSCPACYNSDNAKDCTAETQYCVDGQCVQKCGNGVCDSVENSVNCPGDCHG